METKVPLNRIKRLLTQGLLLAFFLAPMLAQAQLTPLFKFARGEKQKRTVVPFKLVNNLVVIPIFVNGSDTLNFILDTGVNATLVTSLDGVDSLMLPNTTRIELSGLGDGEPIVAIKALNNVVETIGMGGYGQIIYLLEKDIFHLSIYMGMRIHGLIGYSLFSNFVVEIDYRDREVTFHDPHSYRRRRRYQKIPMKVERGKPYIDATVTDPKGSSKKLKLLVDTGASHALSLYSEDSARKFEVPEKSFHSFLGKGLTGDVYGEITRMKSFKVGKYKLKNPITSFPDYNDVAKALSLSQRDGSIGAAMLKRFRVIFDYPKRQILIKKGSNYREPFRYNMSGIELFTPYPGKPYYQVASVRAGSEAEKAGILVGDRLIEIDGRSVLQYSLNKVTRTLQEEPGKNIELLIERNGILIKYTFELKDIL